MSALQHDPLKVKKLTFVYMMTFRMIKDENVIDSQFRYIRIRILLYQTFFVKATQMVMARDCFAHQTFPR